jgi:hypothetical protein
MQRRRDGASPAAGDGSFEEAFGRTVVATKRQAQRLEQEWRAADVRWADKTGQPEPGVVRFLGASCLPAVTLLPRAVQVLSNREPQKVADEHLWAWRDKYRGREAGGGKLGVLRAPGVRAPPPACDTRIRVSQAAAINSLRMANALLAPG